jgi:hypothetical protein
LGNTLITRIFPDPAQAANAKLELLKLQQSGDLATMTAQTDINKEEAKSASLFVSGWQTGNWLGMCVGTLLPIFTKTFSDGFVTVFWSYSSCTDLDLMITYGSLMMGMLRHGWTSEHLRKYKE